MIIASAQTSPTRGNISANIQEHIQLTKLAAKNGANLILFPEMSLSSYERKGAKTLTFSAEDPRLIELQQIADKDKITIIAGAPIALKSGTHIGCFIISPNVKSRIYTKRYLHGEENNYFKSTENINPILEINDERISIAICADINQEQHILDAIENKSTIYLASIFFNNTEMQKAHNLLSNYAKHHKINVLMSNFVGSVWDMTGGGQSGYWNNKGELTGSLNSTEIGILLIKKDNKYWKMIPTIT